MSAADRQLQKMSNMLADHMGAVDALRHELRDSRDEHSNTAQRQDAALTKLDTIYDITKEMLAALKAKQTEATEEPKPATKTDDWKPGKPEIQETLPLQEGQLPPAMNDDDELEAIYTNMLHEERAQGA